MSVGVSKSKQIWLYVNIGVAIALIAAGAGMLLWMGQQASAENTGNAPNPFSQHQARPAPDFTLTSLSGERVSLSDYRGQVVLVNFWATWCPPCKAEMPTINAFYEAHQEKGLVVLAVNTKEETATVRTFMQNHNYSLPVLLDPNGEISNSYQVRGLPTSVLIDVDGQIRQVHSGQINRRQLESMVMPLLEASD